MEMAYSKKKAAKKTRSERSFEELVRQVPVEQFNRMVAKSGMTAEESRELCQAFLELKQ
jgi:hypothetical protein